MGPVRMAKSERLSQVNGAGPSKPRVRRIQPEQDVGLPGVQKIKSALRQTRRLLAKDNVAADVRVATERRQKALEADLHQAEASKKERSLAVRYHKVKFFERQKVTRHLKQVRKRLESADVSSKSQLESTLSELRVDLNYILHYPKMKKYISLLPPDTRQGKAKTFPSEVSDKTDAGRREIRSWIRSRMESGELSSEPELHVEASRVSNKKKALQAGPWDGGGNMSEALNPHNSENIKQDDFFDDNDSE